MIDLPPSLASWRTLNALLPRELAAGLGPWVERLVLAMGPLRAARPRPGGEPDGFSGITRRGSYERLLLSEWLLADELPDEFARRATMGEHAFHAVARRTPSLAASSVALFDAGPDQLGSPRIVHLAALITLAERAERAGARFAWGMLHDPDGALFPSVTAESALRLLSGRTALVTDEDALRAWSTRARKSGWEDVWIVGRSAPPRLPGATWAPASIEAHDVLDPERRAVRVVVSLPSSPARELELDLPEEAACARLLRNPFQRPPAPARARTGAVPTSNLIFSTNGSKLFARGREGEIIGYPVPGSLTASPGRPKRYMPKSRGVVVAVGWLSRALVMLIADEHELRFELTNGRSLEHLRSPIPLPPELGFEAPTPSSPLAPLIFAPCGPRLVPITLDARGALYEMANDLDPPLARVASRVSALAFARGHVSFVGHDVERSATIAGVQLEQDERSGPLELSRWHLIVVGTSERRSKRRPLRGQGSFEAIYGCSERSSPGLILAAVQQNEAEWTIHGGGPPTVLHPPSDTRVVGVYQGGGGADPELLVLEGDKRVISSLSRSSSRSLPRASSEIVHVAQCTSRATLAYVTVTGEVVIHALSHEQPLARYLPR